MLSKAETKRFWDKVSIRGENECWPWTAAKFSSGYGCFSLRRLGGSWRAHRVAYIIKNGYIPSSIMVLHSCDNPPCCNPKHLSAGDIAKNMRDKTERGRQSRLFGSQNPQAKLTARNVRKIKTMLHRKIKHKDIACLFGVSRQAITEIARGKNWV